MTTSGAVPAIRVPDMATSLEFYRDRLGFKLERGGPEDANCSLSFGDASILLDSVPTDFYSPAYNEAIRARMGRTSALALYIEVPDIDEYYARLQAGGVTVVDPLADRPWGQREFTVEDPHGNWLSFWQVLETR